MAKKNKSGINKLIQELKENPKLFRKLTLKPYEAIEEIEYLDENEKNLVSIVNVKDLIELDSFHPGGDVEACGGSCGASCGGSCGGSCGASCAGSCVASCVGSCAGSCVGSGLMPSEFEEVGRPFENERIGVLDKVGNLKNEIKLSKKRFSSFKRH